MSISIPAGPTRLDSSHRVSLVSVLIELTADYPTLDEHTIAQAVEHAASTAELLSPGSRYTHHQVEMLARGRLDTTALPRAVRPADAAARRAVGPP